MAENTGTGWSRFFKLAVFSTFTINLAFVITAAMAVHHSEWHPQLVGFMARVWRLFIAYNAGSTSPGFINSILSSLLVGVFVALYIGFIDGYKAMKDHWVETALMGILAFITVIFIVYGTQFAWQVAHVGYEDHSSLVSQNVVLATDRDSWKKQATNVAAIICNPPKEPVLEVLVDGINVNHRVVTIRLERPTIAQLDMVVKNVGSADAKGVAMRLYLARGYKNPMEGDIVWNKVSSDEPNYPFEYYSTGGYGNTPLIQVGEPWAWASFFIQPESGDLTADPIPVKAKLYYGASKPTIVEFSVKVVARK